MTRRLLPRAVLATLACTALFAGPAAAAPAAPTCSSGAPDVSQPFLSLGDSHWYTLAPGGSFAEPLTGWTLSGGAGVATTVQHDGTTGGVLDLPSKAQAVSPVMCITADYPTARLWIRNVAGSEGVFFYVSYFVKGAWTNPKNTGQFHGDHSAWTLSNPMNVQPGNALGWQPVRFTLIAGGNSSRFQVDDFWVDPRLRT